MWDFHSHILPHIDDGAGDIEEFLEMAKIAVEEGIDVMIATPHYITYESEIPKEKLIGALSNANRYLKDNKIPLEILPGMEVYADWDILDKIDNEEIVTINNTRYLLLELPMIDIPDYIENLLFEIELRGLVPIIAHPERNLNIQKKPNILEEWIKRGILTQLNMGSLTGLYGQQPRKTGEILLKHNMVHLIGTDAHTSGKNSPRIKEGIRILNRLINPRQVKLILEYYPQKILADLEINPGSPLKYKKRLFGK